MATLEWLLSSAELVFYLAVIVWILRGWKK